MTSTSGARRLLGSVRFRITAIAAMAVAIVLVLGAWALVTVQRRQLIENLDAALTQRADDLSALVLAGGSIPDPLPGVAGEVAAAQIVGADGSIRVATGNAQDVPLGPPPDDAGDAIRTVDELAVDDDDFRILSRSLDTPTGPVVVHVAASVDEVRDSTDALASNLRWAIPVIVAGLALGVWWLVGRTLRPVEAMRREAASIDGRDLDRRVPVPPGDDEIGRLARTMNGMLERIADSTRRQERFVADAAHELRSPLTRMRTGLEVDLARAEPGERQPERALLEEVVELGALVEDLLHLARADAGVGHVEAAAVDLDDIVLEEARRLRTGGRVAVDASAVSGASVLGSRRDLTRAVRNLTDNAQRHARSTVSLALYESDGEGVLEVSDDGPGIDGADAERVFERFARTDEARSRSEGGTGLGLAIARAIAEAHGGSLRLRAGDGAEGGATFELRVPLDSAQRQVEDG